MNYRAINCLCVLFICQSVKSMASTPAPTILTHSVTSGQMAPLAIPSELYTALSMALKNGAVSPKSLARQALVLLETQKLTDDKKNSPSSNKTHITNKECPISNHHFSYND